jgi:hypothetical protein
MNTHDVGADSGWGDLDGPGAGDESFTFVVELDANPAAIISLKSTDEP